MVDEPNWDTLESELPPLPLSAGMLAAPRDPLASPRAPDILAADRTASGLRRCATILEGRVGRCEKAVVIPTDFCREHGGYAARAKILSRRDYASMMKGSETLRALFHQFYADEDISDVRAELALQRTMLASFLDQLGIGAGSEGVTTARITPDVIAAVTVLNKTVASLAEQVAVSELRNPTSVSMAQVSWIVKQVCDAVESALIHEIQGDVEVPEEAREFESDGVIDGKRTGDLVRRRIMARVANAMEALVVPNRGVEAKKVFEKVKNE